jgi:transcriptional regulatory protein LevR
MITYSKETQIPILHIATTTTTSILELVGKANKQQEILTFPSSLVQKYNDSQKVHISAPYATCIRRLFA